MRGKLFILLGIITFQGFAQSNKEIIEEHIEYLLEISEEDIDIQQITEQLLEYIQNPLDLNKANSADIIQFPLFTSQQAFDICQHRTQFGPMISIYELQVMQSFNANQIISLTPFIKISNNPVSLQSLRKNLPHAKHQIMTQAEYITPKNLGQLKKEKLTRDSSAHYLGSGIYSNIRYQCKVKSQLEWGFNIEKDAGEKIEFNAQSPLGYDYHSFYLSLKEIGKIRAIQMGDFQANFGQGLTLSTGLSFGKSGIITSTKRNFNGFKPYKSLRENAFLRGIAFAFQKHNFTIGTFLSQKNNDGNITLFLDTILDQQQKFTSNLPEDGGYHRTKSELLHKNRVRDFQTGGYIQYDAKNIKIGTIHHYRKLNTPVYPINKPYTHFDFTGNNYSKNGLYYDVVVKNMNLYGEICYQPIGQTWAQVHGALISLHRNLDLSFLLRNYASSFIPYQTNGFGERSKPNNEKGIYLGYSVQLSPHFRLVGYYDIFKHQHIQYQTMAPARGHDFWAEVQYKPSKKIWIYYRFRSETNQKNGDQHPIPNHQMEKMTRQRVHFTFKLSKAFELRNRIAWNSGCEDNNKSKGSLMYQDIIYKPNKKAYRWSCRMAYSTITSYANRIYSFEKTPLYDYPLFNHSYSGLRFYGLYQYSTTRNTDLWIKYGFTKHDSPIHSLNEQYSIGSGLDKIMGNIKHTLTVQVRHTF